MKEENCIFCKIANKEISTDFLYETDNLVVFKDIHPSAPIHFLIIPKTHYTNIEDTPENIWLEIRQMALTIKDDQKHTGFRLGNNFGDSAFVQHMHVHYLSGINKDRAV